MIAYDGRDWDQQYTKRTDREPDEGAEVCDHGYERGCPDCPQDED